MTTDARLSTLEAQLQQLTINVTTLASITTQQSFEWNQRFNHLAELVASNSKAIEGLTRAIEGLNERMDRLEQALEDRTNTILEVIDRQDAKITGLQADVTGLRTEMQRVIEILGEMRQDS